MAELTTLPKNDGFYMPAEFSPHDGCIMIWPERPGSWIYGGEQAQKTFAKIAEAISESERLIMLASPEGYEKARKMLPDNIEVQVIQSDDAWARDTAPTFVVKDGKVRGISWSFNAWGGEYDGLYSSWEKDDALAGEFCRKNGYDFYNAAPFVLEGGSVHSDGAGTLLVTEACLLSKGRNPSLTKAEIEEKLKNYLGADKVIWLPRGIYNDETNEHVDNVCAFTAPAEVVLAWTDNKSDPQYELSSACLNVLENETDAKGRRIKVHKLPIPDCPVCITEDELCGYTFEDGEDEREAGERLAASYVNFYFSNDAVILPQFGGENEESDRRAVRIMTDICKNRKVIPIYARDVIVGGGNIHCITQQIPKGEK
ncbi:MAG: agmatine deiminase [Oscillospiraceae bacterium]